MPDLQVIQWRDLTPEDTLRVGMKIRSRRNGVSHEPFWYTGIIHSLYPSIAGMVNVDIQRNDGQHGGGHDSTWNTMYNQIDCSGYMIEQEMDWDT